VTGEVGDDAVLHGLDGDDVAGGAAEHLLGLLADGLDLIGLGVDGDDGGLVDDDALAVPRRRGCWRCPGRWPGRSENRLKSERMEQSE
jgi:hypothetical protein